MSAFDHGAAAMLRKLIFGMRADLRGATASGADDGCVEPATGTLPRAVSGGEDFTHDDTET